SPPQLRVVPERRLRKIEAVVIDVQVRGDAKLAGVRFAHTRERLRRHVAGDMKFSGAIAIQFDSRLRDEVMADAIDRCRTIVPVVLVSLELDQGAELPL